MAGLVPAISRRKSQCSSNRDTRDKPAYDNCWWGEGYRPPNSDLQLVLRLRGRGCVAPGRRVGAIAPVARPVERVHPDLAEPRHLAHPARERAVRVVVGGLADIVDPELAVERLARNLLRPLIGVRLAHAIRNAVAGEGELAAQAAVRVLIDDAAHVVRIVAGKNAVHHDLRDRDLA